MLFGVLAQFGRVFELTNVLKIFLHIYSVSDSAITNSIL